MNELIDKIAKIYDTFPDAIFSLSRKRNIVDARFMYIGVSAKLGLAATEYGKTRKRNMMYKFLELCEYDKLFYQIYKDIIVGSHKTYEEYFHRKPFGEKYFYLHKWTIKESIENDLSLDYNRHLAGNYYLSRDNALVELKKRRNNE